MKNLRWTLVALAGMMLWGRVWAIEVKAIDPLAYLPDAEHVKKAEALPKMRLVGPRNGYTSGQAVVLGEGADKVKASLSAFAGPGKIPAEAVRIRYARKAPWTEQQLKEMRRLGTVRQCYRNPEPCYDILDQAPPADATLLPIWVTVKIPAEAAAGDYKATLTIDQTKVPVELRVGKWLCPAPREWTAHLNTIWCSDTLAIHYKAPAGSDAYWKLVEEELKLLGGLGQKVLHVPVIRAAHLGYDDGWVRVRKGSNGWSADFSFLDRYLDLYLKHVGKPEYTVVWVFESSLCKQAKTKHVDWMGDANHELRDETEFSGLDEAGKPVRVKVPVPGNPGSEEVFKPIMDGIKERVEQKMGRPAESIVLGGFCDTYPPGEVVGLFDKIAPYAGWYEFAHMYGGNPAPGLKFLRHVAVDWKARDSEEIENIWKTAMEEISKQTGKEIKGDKWAQKSVLWSSSFKDDQVFLPPLHVLRVSYLVRPYSGGEGSKGIRGGWEGWDFPFCQVTQYRNGFFQNMLLSMWRYSPDIGSAGHYRGLSEVGLDYWPLEDGKTRFFTYMPKDWMWLYRSGATSLLLPGAGGPLGTVPYEMFREGKQECEARIAIEKAIVTGKANKAAAEFLVQRWKVLTGNGKRGGTMRDSLPLSEITKDNVSPELWEKYCALEEGIKEGKNSGKNRYDLQEQRWDIYITLPPEKAGCLFDTQGWQDLAAKLFDLAGEVEDKSK